MLQLQSSSRAFLLPKNIRPGDGNNQIKMAPLRVAIIDCLRRARSSSRSKQAKLVERQNEKQQTSTNEQTFPEP